MRLSYTRKAITISALLVTTGLLGQAAAAQTATTHARAVLAPSAPATAVSAAPAAAAASAAASAAPQRPAGAAAVPAAKPDATSGRTEKARPVKRNRPRNGGPAGSISTTGYDAVALTFDDGPDPQYTPQLLELLAKERVKATFCVVGQQAKRHPDLIRAIARAGHSLCNHSWDHDLKLGKKPVAKIKADLERTNAAIHAAAPNAKIRYMRAPGGNFTPALVRTAGSLGMLSVYWKVDPRDWEQPKKESGAAHRKKIIRVVMRKTRPGAIVLSHDYAQPETIAAYRVLLPWLHKRYRLIPLT